MLTGSSGAGSKNHSSAGLADFVRQTDDLDAGALLNTLDAPTLGRANADATLAEVWDSAANMTGRGFMSSKIGKFAALF